MKLSFQLTDRKPFFIFTVVRIFFIYLNSMSNISFLLERNFFLFSLKKKKTCLLVYYNYMSLNFTAKTFLSFWLKKNVFVLIENFFYHIFLKIIFYVYHNKFKFYWQNIFLSALLKKKKFSYNKWKFQLTLLREKSLSI